ncbi:MAG: hypothetical protein WKF84_20560 [Pyrinomonadaceae bacterium]
MLILQGVLPAVSVYLTKLVIDSLLVAERAEALGIKLNAIILLMLTASVFW